MRNLSTSGFQGAIGATWGLYATGEESTRSHSWLLTDPTLKLSPISDFAQSEYDND